VRALFARLQDKIQVLDEQIARSDQAIKQAVQRDERCQRLMSMDGIGPLIATALVAAIGSGQAFNNGRQVAAWLGLVPRQHSSGGRPTLLGISKRGDRYLRTLLIHGARAVIYRVKDATSPRAQWLKQLIERDAEHQEVEARSDEGAQHRLEPDLAEASDFFHEQGLERDRTHAAGLPSAFRMSSR
jgi:transposase